MENSIKIHKKFRSGIIIIDDLTLTLSFTELPRLRDASDIESMQDQAQLMLHEACANQSKDSQTISSPAVKKNPNKEDNSKSTVSNAEDVTVRNKLRFGKCLLLLPLIKEINADAIEQIFFSKVIGGDSQVGKLLCNIYSHKTSM